MFPHYIHFPNEQGRLSQTLYCDNKRTIENVLLILSGADLIAKDSLGSPPCKNDVLPDLLFCYSVPSSNKIILFEHTPYCLHQIRIGLVMSAIFAAFYRTRVLRRKHVLDGKLKG